MKLIAPLFIALVMTGCSTMGQPVHTFNTKCLEKPCKTVQMPVDDYELLTQVYYLYFNISPK